jgi:FAD/FMN-containing dehydrogenase
LLEALYDEVTRLGGSITAEQGVGRLKAASVKKRKSEAEWKMIESFKTTLDAHGILNSGVLFGSSV